MKVRHKVLNRIFDNVVIYDDSVICEISHRDDPIKPQFCEYCKKSPFGIEYDKCYFPTFKLADVELIPDRQNAPRPLYAGKGSI